MELQTVIIENPNLIPSGATIENISVRRSGIAKLLRRELNVQCPKSEVIIGGVEKYNN